jgi:HSP20 family protein
MKRNRRNKVSRWDPFRELDLLQEQMSQLFRNAFGDFSGNRFGLITGNGFAPAADVYEDENNLKLRFEIPGVRPDDINVTLDGGVLTVKGERKLAEGDKEGNYLRVERAHGPFYRSFTLPNSVDPNTLTANYNNGVLELTIGKRAEAKPKQIKINAGQKALGSNAAAEKAAA